MILVGTKWTQGYTAVWQTGPCQLHDKASSGVCVLVCLVAMAQHPVI